MDLSEMQTRAAELEQQIANLPAGSVTKTRNRIVKRTGRDPVLSAPCRIRQTALPALSHQFHPFIQGTPWGTFVSHNETSMCSEFLSSINGME